MSTLRLRHRISGWTVSTLGTDAFLGSDRCAETLIFGADSDPIPVAERHYLTRDPSVLRTAHRQTVGTVQALVTLDLATPGTIACALEVL